MKEVINWSNVGEMDRDKSFGRRRRGGIETGSLDRVLNFVDIGHTYIQAKYGLILIVTVTMGFFLSL